MSDISIVRWFLGLTLEVDTSQYFSNSDRSIILKYQRLYGLSTLSMITNNLHRQIMEYRFDSYLKNYTIGLFIGKYHWEITEILVSNKFLDTDDISLILTYGRDILDENIIKRLNENSFKTDLNTFKSIIESDPYE